MTTFDQYLGAIVTRGEQGARDDSSATIEAQHLLLAITAGQEPSTHQVLTSVGLNHQTVREFLDRELDQSLSTVGVSRTAYDLPRPSPALEHPKLGASAKLALERAVTSGAPRKKDLRPLHLLLGILQAQVGTVPRVLALAGIDRDDLKTRVLRRLSGESE